MADPALIADPHSLYRRLRKTEPVHWAASGYRVARRYADARSLLAHPSFGQGEFIRNIQMFYPPGFDVLAYPSSRWLPEAIVMQDPPHHTRLRKLVAHALTPARIQDMAPRIESIANAPPGADASAARGPRQRTALPLLRAFPG